MKKTSKRNLGAAKAAIGAMLWRNVLLARKAMERGQPGAAEWHAEAFARWQRF